MDEAILKAAEAKGIAGTRPEAIETFPFTEDRKRESAIVRTDDGRLLVVTKGAAEVVLAMSTLDDAERAAWVTEIARLAEGAHKVITVASRAVDVSPVSGREPDAGFEFAGLLAFEDPVREGVRDAVADCDAAGIHPIMVTGDHPMTALAVAKSVGIGGDAPRLFTGEELEGFVTHGNGNELLGVDVIARAKPSQKLMLVRGLQASGEIVAVTGDGVNDVPALQAADVGVAMGERGTRSAREVAAIVLLDDNFRTIVGAIREGRQLFQNLRSSFQYLLMIHIPFVVTATLIPLAGYKLLYLPVHIVLLEIMIHSTAMFAFQEPAGRVLARRTGVARQARFFDLGEWV
jgi:P-type Ca2+ transporter type 2C